MEKCKVEFETQVGWSNWKKLEEVQLLEIIVINDNMPKSPMTIFEI